MSDSNTHQFRLDSVLDRFLKRCRDIRETNRVLAVKLAFLGFPYDMICNLIGVSKSLITKWKKKYKKQGSSPISFLQYNLFAITATGLK